eukprot:5474836-Amphidinium_carterae.3
MPGEDTELEDARRGPALKARLEGVAYMYRAVLNRDRLKAVNGDGVGYFLDTLRPYFTKQTFCFLYRFFQILKLHRGGQDINRWITRFEVVLDKAKTAWMELLIVLVPDADVCARANATVNLGRDQALVQIVPDAAAIAFARNELENEIRDRHRRSFPFTSRFCRRPPTLKEATEMDPPE